MGVINKVGYHDVYQHLLKKENRNIWYKSRELHEDMNIEEGKQTITKALTKLFQAGLVEKKGGGFRNTPLYRLKQKKKKGLFNKIKKVFK